MKSISKKKKIIIFILLFILDKVNIITKFGLSPTLWTSVIAMSIPLTVTILLWSIEKQERVSEIEESNKLQKQLTVRVKYIDYFEELITQLRDFEIFIDCYLKNKDNPFAFNKSEDEKFEQNINSSFKAIRGIGGHHDSNEVWKFDYNETAFKSLGINIFEYNYNNEVISLRGNQILLPLVNELSNIRKGWGTEIRGLGIYSKDYGEEFSKEVIKDIFTNEEYIDEVKALITHLKADIEARLSI